MSQLFSLGIDALALVIVYWIAIYHLDRIKKIESDYDKMLGDLTKKINSLQVMQSNYTILDIRLKRLEDLLKALMSSLNTHKSSQ